MILMVDFIIYLQVTFPPDIRKQLLKHRHWTKPSTVKFKELMANNKN